MNAANIVALLSHQPNDCVHSTKHTHTHETEIRCVCSFRFNFNFIILYYLSSHILSFYRFDDCLLWCRAIGHDSNEIYVFSEFLCYYLSIFINILSHRHIRASCFVQETEEGERGGVV